MEKPKDLDKMLDKIGEMLGPNDQSFLKRVYQNGLSIYSDRLKALNFEGPYSVLDAGCGFGQWTLALSNLNLHVAGTDISEKRVRVCSEIAEELGITNIEFKQAELHKQPYPDNSFDLVFCYGAIFISYPHLVLKEFQRILKPGGKLYVNANGLGFTLNLWLNAPNATEDYNPREKAAKAFANTVNYKKGLPKSDGQIIIEKEEMISMLAEAGFETLHCAGEGMINLTNDKIKINPFFKSEYFGFTGVYEILAQKK